MNNISNTIGMIGVGNMGRSIVEGLIQSGESIQLNLYDRHPEQLASLTNHPHITLCTDPLAVVNQSMAIILAVKPQSMKDALAEIKDFNQDRKPLFISVAAGIPLQAIQQALCLDEQYPMARLMPNTPACIQQAASGLFGINLNSTHKSLVQTIATAIGKSAWLDDESDIDVVTALSGSGPAYFFYIFEAFIQAAKDLGLNEAAARTLTLQTALGAAKMALQSETPLESLRQQVTSKGGTTEAGLATLANHQFQQIMIEAVKKATERGKELAKALD